jgi:hypothetical protein
VSWTDDICPARWLTQPLRAGSWRLKDERRPQLAATQVLDQSLAEDAVPAFDGSQLLRSFAQLGKEGSDARQRATRMMMFAMRAGDRNRRAAGVVGLSADGLKQQRPAGNCLAMMVGLSQTHEQIPPVEHQGDAARHQAASFEIVRCEAAPAPLVLELVEAVFDMPLTTPLIS